MAHGLILGLEAGVTSAGDQASHVESRSYARSPATDLMAAGRKAALGWVRGNAGKPGDGTSIDRTELRQVDDERRCDRRADAGQRAQDDHSACQFRLAVKLGGDLAFDKCSLLRERS